MQPFKNAAYDFFSVIKLYNLVSKLCFRNAFVIICYHGIVKSPLPVYDYCFIEESTFHHHIRYLKKHFSIQKLSDVRGAFEKKTIGKPLLAITFDDGFQSNYNLAYPILLKEKVPATIFLTTTHIDSSEILWFCKLNHALTVTSKTEFEWEGKKLDIGDNQKKALASEYLQHRLKRLPHTELNRELNHIIENLGLDTSIRVGEDSPYRMLNSRAIREMADSALIDFGSHTRTHAILSKLSKEKQHDEIVNSINEIRNRTGLSCRLFAYPNGDFNEDTLKILSSCGIKTAVTTMAEPNTTATNSLLLNRICIGGNIRFGHFQAQIHFITWFAKGIGNRFLRFFGLMMEKRKLL